MAAKAQGFTFWYAKKIFQGDWRDAQGLRTCSARVEDSSVFPSTYVGRLTTPS